MSNCVFMFQFGPVRDTLNKTKTKHFTTTKVKLTNCCRCVAGSETTFFWTQGHIICLLRLHFLSVLCSLSDWAEMNIFCLFQLVLFTNVCEIKTKHKTEQRIRAEYSPNI